MLPSGSGSPGLLEKRVLASSALGLTHEASQFGDKNKSLADTMLLDDDVDLHNNHANDPATDTLNLADAAVFNADWNRPLETVMSLTGTAHAVLEGYQSPPNEHKVTANETVVTGQPVFMSGNNTVNLADATTVATANVVGFISSGATANNIATMLTEGHIVLADWTSVIGSASLTPGATYFLDTTKGQMTTTPPTTDGNVVVTLGIAITTAKFDIEVNEVAIL
jgi:hypothetical protein